MTSIQLSAQKKMLRTEALAERAGLSDASRRASDGLLIPRLEAWLLARKVNVVFAFRSHRGEPDLSPLFATHQPWRVALPVAGDTPTAMRFYFWEAGQALTKSRLGIQEPDPSACEEAPVTAGTVVLVPSVLLDGGGHRLGYGGGYYDRFLSAHAALVTVGVVHEQFVRERLPVEDHDLKVRWIATELGVRARA